MFSTDNTLQGHSSRNPRRRPRTSENDLVPSKRRKRSSINPETFHAPAAVKANGIAHKSIEHQSLPNGTREKTAEPETIQESHQNGHTSRQASLVVRNKSGRSHRDRKPTRHEDGIILAKNDRYQVTKDTNLPDEVQDVVRAKDPWQAHFNEDLGYAVILTHTKAVIWQYAQSTLPSTSRVTVVKFDNGTPRSKDPLPVGALVHDLGAGELALLIIRAGGKVIYWDSVASAANADLLRQKQNGLFGNISSLLSSEQIIDIQEAEPDGFVLTTSAGRVLHLSVRDSNGRPNIVTELLPGASSNAGGLFGSIKSALSISSWRKDIAAVKCTSSKTKGHRKCIIISKQGVIQVWDLARQSNKTLESEVDARGLISKRTQPMDGPAGDVQVVDFAFLPNKKHKDNSHHLLLLVGVQTSQKWSYSLLEMQLEREGLEIKHTYPVNFWSQPPEDDKPWLALRSRLHVPEPGHTAIITVDNAILVASLVLRTQGSSAQLDDELEPKADAYQDVLYFAKDRDLHLVGAAAASLTQGSLASCQLFVNDFGLVQVTAKKSKEVETVEERRATQCQSKVEQVVFYGDAPNKLFDFQRALDTADWSDNEIEIAAEKVNESILNSTSNFVPKAIPAMDLALKERSSNLKALIKFVSKWNLSPATRWYLLWSAEKMASARAIWQVYSGHLAKREEQQIPFRGRHTVLLWEAVELINEDYKTNGNPERGENDVVRQYLLRDVARLEILVANAAKALEEMDHDGVDDVVHHAWLACQASDVVRVALDTAYKFRETSAALYGFSPELFEDGIYTGNYDNMDDIWTSCQEICITMPNLARYAQDIAFSLTNDEAAEEDSQHPEDPLVKLVEDTIILARLTCQVGEEHLRYLEKRAHVKAEDFKWDYHSRRKEMLTGFVELMVPDDGLKLAEKYRDLGALADITCASRKFIFEQLDRNPTEQKLEVLETKRQEYAQRIQKYFDDYGMKWAQAYYTERMHREGAATVIKSGGQYLEEYLNKNPSLTKAKWIYDVGTQQTYKDGVRDLLTCNNDESNLWNKKVLLSLAKLSLFAAEEKNQTTKDSALSQMRHADRRLTTIDIQDHLYNYTYPHLQSALDEIASLDLAMEMFGCKIKDTHVTALVFRQSFEKLIRRSWVGEENLIDCLTLMNCPPDILDDDEFASSRFFFALQMLRDSPVWEDTERASFLRKVIWRRAVIQDDWVQINSTGLRLDEEVTRDTQSTALFKTLMAGFHDGLLNEDLPPPESITSLLDLGTTPESLSSIKRFHGLDRPTLEAIAAEYTAEDERLRQALEKGRLGEWWPGLMLAARHELTRRIDGEGEENAEAARENREAERKLSGVNGVNGHAYSSSPAPEAMQDRRDDDGDVFME